jgi:hypothetical protein
VFDKPSDTFFTPQNAGADTIDSDVDATGVTDWVTLSSGEEDMTVDAGIRSAPETLKVLIGTIFYDGILTDYLEADDNEYNEYISSDTIIYLNYTYPDLLDDTYYRVWKWDCSEEEWILLIDWNTTTQGGALGFYPINLCYIGEYFGYLCCGLYQIEYYSVEIGGHIEKIKWNNVCVDCVPPDSIKEYGYPNVVEYWGSEPVHFITSDTLIYINATDDPCGCGSGIREIWYQLLYPDGTLGDWIEYTGPFTVDGPDGIYIIYYYAIDNIGHVEKLNKQKFVLDNIPPLGDVSMILIEPENQSISRETDFSFSIKLIPSEPIKALQCTLYYDPTIITINNMSGTLFSNFIEGTIDNIHGIVTAIIGYNEDIEGGVDTEGIFAMVNGTSQNVNGVTTLLELVDVIALDESNNPVDIIVYDGLIEIEVPECPYDLNGDDIVDETDLSMVLSHFGETGFPGWITADLSGPMGMPDGIINIFDVIAIADHWGACP